MKRCLPIRYLNWCRILYILIPPTGLMVCIAGMIVAACTQAGLFTLSPLAAVAFGCLRQLRWSMVWLSTPAELSVLRSGIGSDRITDSLHSQLRLHGSEAQLVRSTIRQIAATGSNACDEHAGGT